MWKEGVTMKKKLFRKICSKCGGSGICKTCGGKGCMDCDYLGSCSRCKGSGKE